MTSITVVLYTYKLKVDFAEMARLQPCPRKVLWSACVKITLPVPQRYSQIALAKPARTLGEQTLSLHDTYNILQ